MPKGTLWQYDIDLSVEVKNVGGADKSTMCCAVQEEHFLVNMLTKLLLIKPQHVF